MGVGRKENVVGRKLFSFQWNSNFWCEFLRVILRFICFQKNLINVRRVATEISRVAITNLLI